MIPLFTLPMPQLRAEHVDQLRAEELPEGQTVEYKEALPKRKGEADAWLSRSPSVGEYARNKVLAEIVAFANAGGGNLVLGIRESDDHPKRAAGVCVLPRCHELADRFRHMARDCIEPMLPSIEVCGIPMPGGDEGAGVVLFRVPPSRLSPHRLENDRHCYVRRADRTERMIMREIQDMSVRLLRDGEEIERRLEESRERCLEIGVPAGNHAQHEVGARAAALPIGGSIFIDKVYQADGLELIRGQMPARLDGVGYQVFLPGWHNLPESKFRPGLRMGWRDFRTEHRVTVERVHCDGLVEFVYKDVNKDEPIYVGKVLGMAANALLLADVARRIAGVPGAEIILDVELRCDHYQTLKMGVNLAPLRSGRHDLPFWVMAGDDPRHKARLDQPLHAPRQSVGGRDTFQGALHRLLDDLRNACHQRHVERFEIDLGES